MPDRYSEMDIEVMRGECRRLDRLINEPAVDDFFAAVKIECAHQRERWGESHDLLKSPADFVGTAVYLLGKALSSFWAGDRDKGLHHIVTTAALCANWFRIARVQP